MNNCFSTSRQPPRSQPATFLTGTKCSASVPPRIAWPSWLCAATSPALLVTFVTLMLHVRLGFGHWPKPMWEDYSTVALKAHELVALWLFATATFVAPVIGLGLLCFRTTRGGWRFHLRQLALFAIAWILVLALWHADPFQFVTWLKD